ncbi:MAG: hypothetical protein IKC97_01870 [Clostridia bacterium]|nr:hypothetical protein [Clostridia bacterium]
MLISFHDWIYSDYPPQRAIVNGRYGAIHIATILFCIALVIAISLLHKKDKTTRTSVIKALAFAILLFEIIRRVINFTRGEPMTTDTVLYYLLPRPWCAISCWMTIAAALTGKKTLYNFSAMCSLLCSLVFFVYPVVGFNHGVYLFEDVYSIATHSLLFITSLSMMTLGLTDFRYHREHGKGAWQELFLLCLTFTYAFVEIFVLEIEKDPLYFRPGNDVQKVFGFSYPVFLVVYVGFLLIYFNAFYIVPYLVQHYHKPKALHAAA